MDKSKERYGEEYENASKFAVFFCVNYGDLRT